MEAIVLAGGLGTRLRSAVPDLPKPMAPIGNRPFLSFVLDGLADAGFETAVLAVGYRSEAIREYFKDHYGALRIRYSIEDKALGTGGAIRLGLEKTVSRHVFVLNGDTYLELDYRAMYQAHMAARASITVAVRCVGDTARYGALEIGRGRVQGFVEKGRSGPGVINGGTYLVSRDLFARYALPEAFSLETDVLMPYVSELRPLAFEAEGMFIDIGVPEDYARAREVLAQGQEATGHGLHGD